MNWSKEVVTNLVFRASDHSTASETQTLVSELQIGFGDTNLVFRASENDLHLQGLKHESQNIMQGDKCQKAYSETIFLIKLKLWTCVGETLYNVLAEFLQRYKTFFQGFKTFIRVSNHFSEIQNHFSEFRINFSEFRNYFSETQKYFSETQKYFQALETNIYSFEIWHGSDSIDLRLGRYCRWNENQKE